MSAGRGFGRSSAPRAMQATDVLEFSGRASRNYPAASAAASRWRVCSPSKHRSSWRTSRPPRSIRAIRSISSLRAAADQGALVIVVTHDLSLAARFADRVLVLSQGRLVAQGNAAEALSEQVMADVFRISAYRAEYQREAVIVPWAEV
jgi:iron complex transport system ATP-binding protein